MDKLDLSDEAEDIICFSGVDIDTGELVTPPMSEATLAELVRKRWTADKGDMWPLSLASDFGKSKAGLPPGAKPELLSSVGWAILHHVDEEREVLDALEPLIQLRIGQAGRRVDVEPYDGKATVEQWLRANEVHEMTKIVPSRVPLYLLVVGSPERIPFDFCHQLHACGYLTGRLDFVEAGHYRAYAENVVRYETAATVENARRIDYFAPIHPHPDRAGSRNVNFLLERGLLVPDPDVEDLTTNKVYSLRVVRREATRAALLGLIARPKGDAPPAILFTASHGAHATHSQEDKEARQGALVCQEWSDDRPTTKSYVTAEDVEREGVRLGGAVVFHMACYSAGTPPSDRFSHLKEDAVAALTKRPFTARLPQTLLRSPGGPLAMIGHIDRTWVTSYVKGRNNGRVGTFRYALSSILMGLPVGMALKHFYDRYAQASIDLTRMYEQLGQDMRFTNEEIVETWMNRNDAEGFVLLGDPAVKLRVDLLRMA